MLAAGATQVLFAWPLADLMVLDGLARTDRLIEIGTVMARAATHSAIFCIVFAPIAILIGEVQRLRGWTYYTLAGVLISLCGFAAEYAAENAAQPTILNSYALMTFISTGAVSGFFYWIVSGQNAGRRRSVAAIRVASRPDARTAETADDASGGGTQPVMAHSTETNESRGDDKLNQEAGTSDIENAPDESKSTNPTRPRTSVPSAGPQIKERPPTIGAETVGDRKADEEQGTG